MCNIDLAIKAHFKIVSRYNVKIVSKAQCRDSFKVQFYNSSQCAMFKIVVMYNFKRVSRYKSKVNFNVQV